MDAKQVIRTIVEEYKAGVYSDSREASLQVAIAIEQADAQNFTWLMIMLDDNLPKDPITKP